MTCVSSLLTIISFIITQSYTESSGVLNFRSYVTRRDIPSDVTIVEAVLETCRIQPAFVPVSNDSTSKAISDGNFVINPIYNVLKEAQSLFGGDTRLGSLVSLGSHLAPDSPASFSTDARPVEPGRILSSSEEIAKQAEQQFGPLGFYFRLSFHQFVYSEVIFDFESVIPQTIAYLEEPSTSSKLDQCVMVLESRLGLVAFDQLGMY